MPDAVASPFTALSLSAATAILTKASSVLRMSTSTRLVRAVERARDLALRSVLAGASKVERTRTQAPAPAICGLEPFGIPHAAASGRWEGAVSWR